MTYKHNPTLADLSSNFISAPYTVVRGVGDSSQSSPGVFEFFPTDKNPSKFTSEHLNNTGFRLESRGDFRSCVVTLQDCPFNRIIIRDINEDRSTLGFISYSQLQKLTREKHKGEEPPYTFKQESTNTWTDQTLPILLAKSGEPLKVQLTLFHPGEEEDSGTVLFGKALLETPFDWVSNKSFSDLVERGCLNNYLFSLTDGMDFEFTMLNGYQFSFRGIPEDNFVFTEPKYKIGDGVVEPKSAILLTNDINNMNREEYSELKPLKEQGPTSFVRYNIRTPTSLSNAAE